MHHHIKTSDKLNKLLTKHSVVFKDELGTHCLELRLRSTSRKVKFFKARNVPYIMRERDWRKIAVFIG